MRKLHKLLMAALVIAPLTACDEGNDTITPAPPAPAIGTVSGTVAVEGSGIAGITVQLAGASAASTTTGSNGSFSFANVVEGNYSVTISGISGDYAFATTSQTVTVNTNGQTVTADFNGSWVRTSSVLVNVERADGQGVATTVTLAGEGEDQSLGTNAQGAVTFSGLKKGAYTVTIPAIEGFSTTSASVTLNTGQAAQVNFVGERELLPPEISIADVFDADLTDVFDFDESGIVGPIEVVLNVRPNGNTLTSVELWMLQKSTGNIYRVGNQRFAALAGPLAAGEDVANVEFTVNPAATFRRDGSHPSIQQLGDDGFEALAANAMRPYHPVFVDGDYELHGVVKVAEAEGSFNAIVDVTLASESAAGEAAIADGIRNDHVIMRVETDNTDWEDPVSGEYFPNSLIKSTDGLLWHSGDVTATAYPVLFSAPYNPNDPSLARATLTLDAISGGEKVFADDDFNADGSISWLFCENTTPNAGGVAADCDASVAGVLDSDIDAFFTSVTKFGQPATSYELTWLEDLFSGTDDVLRLDNDAPTAATIAADDAASAKTGALPHPGNLVATTITTDFSRTQLSGANNLGWVKHSDVLDPVVTDAAISDGAGIGLPGTAATRPSLIYVAGPDVAATVNDVAKTIAAAAVSGLTLSGDDLPAETDEAYLVAIGSAAGSPFSDSELDYQLAARNWDLFGNWVNSSNYVTLGVDNLAPIFTNAAGTAAAPVDPTTYKDPATDPAASVYNTYSPSHVYPDTTAATNTYGAQGLRVKEPGLYAGFVSDSGNGFAGIAGLVMERWESANGARVASTTQFHYAAETAAEPEPFTFQRALLANTFPIVAWTSSPITWSALDGYRDNTVHVWDRAGNYVVDNASSERIDDMIAPVVNSLSVPAGPFAYNTAYSWTANVADSIDLKKGHAGFSFAVSSIGANLANANAGTGPASFVLPVQNTAFSAFGSAVVTKAGSITLSSAIPCLARFDEGGYAARVVPTHAAIEVWDHASAYGRTASNMTPIAVAGTFCATSAAAINALVPTPNTAGAFLFQVASGKPQIVLSGPTSTFTPAIDFDNIDLYYLDRAGSPILMATSAADWSLNVTDAGAGALGRKYTYTFNGTLPAAGSRIPTAVLTALGANNGTEGGYFMTLKVGGTWLIWDDTVN